MPSKCFPSFCFTTTRKSRNSHRYIEKEKNSTVSVDERFVEAPAESYFDFPLSNNRDNSNNESSYFAASD
jgi:hypothetical protein